MPVILPNIYAEEKDIRGPLFFILCPEKGSDDAHYRVYKKFQEKLGDNFCAAVPVRYQDDRPDHPILGQRLKSPSHAHTRLDWIHHYIEEAGIKYMGNGCIVGYLPEESATAPRTDKIPYARKTLSLIDEMRGRMMYDPRRIRFVLGADPKFPGLNTIVRNFNKRSNNTFKIHGSIDETVAAAIKLVTQERMP